MHTYDSHIVHVLEIYIYALLKFENQVAKTSAKKLVMLSKHTFRFNPVHKGSITGCVTTGMTQKPITV